MEVFVFGWWWTFHQSLAQEGLRILRFCIVNDNPEPNIAWEDRLSWLKSSKGYWTLDRIDGLPVEFEWNLPRIHHFAVLPESPRVTVKIEYNTRKLTGLVIFVSMFNDISWGSKDNRKECESKCSTPLPLRKESWSRTMVILRTWIRKELVFYSRVQSTGRLGQNCRENDVDICKKQTSNLSIHESIVKRSA